VRLATGSPSPRPPLPPPSAAAGAAGGAADAAGRTFVRSFRPSTWRCTSRASSGSSPAPPSPSASDRAAASVLFWLVRLQTKTPARVQSNLMRHARPLQPPGRLGRCREEGHPARHGAAAARRPAVHFQPPGRPLSRRRRLHRRRRRNPHRLLRGRSAVGLPHRGARAASARGARGGRAGAFPRGRSVLPRPAVAARARDAGTVAHGAAERQQPVAVEHRRCSTLSGPPLRSARTRGAPRGAAGRLGLACAGEHRAGQAGGAGGRVRRGTARKATISSSILTSSASASISTWRDTAQSADGAAAGPSGADCELLAGSAPSSPASAALPSCARRPGAVRWRGACATVGVYVWLGRERTAR
jgi:hypothetical protein